MTKISASTFFVKRMFPTVWFGFLALFVVGTIITGAVEQDPLFLVMPIFMAVIGYFLMKKLAWDLVDEVHDCGDFLLVRNKGDEEKVPFTNIMSVNVSTNSKPPRITLRLVKPNRFGEEIAFLPKSPFTFNPFAKNPVGEELVVRVDRARSRRAV